MAYGASVYAGFGSVWTSVGFLLAGPPFRLSDAEIGLFALFGVAGALAARVAGRLADRGHAHVGTGVFLAATTLGFAALAPGDHSLIWLAIGLVLFDLGVQGTHIRNQSVIYRLDRHARSRLDAVYIDVLLHRRCSRIRPLCRAVHDPRLGRGVLARRRLPGRRAAALDS